ncbi:hypothetical protein BHM03_00010104, partial [Ensete ventricosum]
GAFRPLCPLGPPPPRPLSIPPPPIFFVHFVGADYLRICYQIYAREDQVPVALVRCAIWIRERAAVWSLDLPMWMDSNSCWIVRPQPDSYARQGGIIETGTSVRLQHTRTRRWLHSYLHASPLSGNLEVGEVLVFTWILIFDKGFEFLSLISVSSNCQLMKS